MMIWKTAYAVMDDGMDEYVKPWVLRVYANKEDALEYVEWLKNDLPYLYKNVSVVETHFIERSEDVD